MSKENVDPPELVSKELCDEKHKRVDEKLDDHEKRMDCYEKDVQRINTKITATLIFIIIMLVTLLIDLAKSGIHL